MVVVVVMPVQLKLHRAINSTLKLQRAINSIQRKEVTIHGRLNHHMRRTHEEHTDRSPPAGKLLISQLPRSPDSTTGEIGRIFKFSEN